MTILQGANKRRYLQLQIQYLMNPIVPILLIRMKRIVRTFRRAGATEPGRALVPSEHGLREEFAFRRLVRSGVLVAVNPQRWYLNEEAEAQYQRRRQRAIVIVLIFGLTLLFLTWLTSRH